MTQDALPSSGRVTTDVSYTPSPFSTKNKILRVCWNIVYILLFRYSPKPAANWRRMLLRLFGAKMAHGAKVAASAKVWAPWNLQMGRYSSLAHSVDCYNQGPIFIGDNSTVSQYAHLCASTHDYTKPNLPLVAYSIHIGSSVWICADVFVGPDVTIHDGVVVGARSSVFTDLPEWKVCVGSPARPIKDRIIRTEP